jgi:hypothetical protein
LVVLVLPLSLLLQVALLLSLLGIELLLKDVESLAVVDLPQQHLSLAVEVLVLLFEK